MFTETCLSFIRSSFRMSKTTVAPTEGHPLTNGSMLKNGFPYARPDEKHTSAQETNAKSFVSDHPKPSKLGLPLQDNLQIIAAGSINEAEFKSMMVHPSKTLSLPHHVPEPKLSRRLSATLVTDSNLPSASQLQSVLPVLMNNNPRQPTPKEVQQLLAKLPETPIISASPLGSNACIKTPVTTISATNFITKTSDANRIQNGLTNGSVVTCTNVYSGKGMSTVISAVPSSITPEQYSGNTPAANASGYKKPFNFSPVQLQRNLSPNAYSSDEQGNSVEISSDEESECDTWSADRSVLSSTDLSSTPCHAAALMKAYAPGLVVVDSMLMPLPLNLTNKAKCSTDDEKTSSQKNVVKCSSLPPPVKPPNVAVSLSRTHSMDCGKTQIITFEKAASAMEALSFSPSNQMASPSSATSKLQVDKKCEDLPKSTFDLKVTDHVENVPTPNHSDDADTVPNSTIVSRAIYRNLLPPKNSSKNTSPPFVTLTPWAGSDSRATIHDNEDDEQVKVEQCSENELDEDGGFPTARLWSSEKKAFDMSTTSLPSSTSPDALEISEASIYSVEDQNTSNDIEEMVLDLSVPRPVTSDSILSGNYKTSDENTDPGTSSSTQKNDIVLFKIDAGTQMAVDTLCSLSQLPSKAANTSLNGSLFNCQNDLVESNKQPNNLLEANSNRRTAAATSAADFSPENVSSEGYLTSQPFSRKPRRTMGGQTCMWPGCGRLFRHRNIYEEHKRLHEIGIPVSQLRKCYMGARVKKTVREQLEELRTNDNPSEGGTESSGGKYLRVRKRKPDNNEEPLRKRVNVKDRVAPIQVFTQPSSTTSHTSDAYLYQQPICPPVPVYQTTPRALFPPRWPPAAIGPISPGSRLMRVVGPDGIMRVVPSTAALPDVISQRGVVVSNQQSARKSNVSPRHGVPTTAVSAAQPITTFPFAPVNPVEATLAQLGIRTPIRRNTADPGGFSTNIPMSNLSTDMRRHLAIRETGPLSESLAVRNATCIPIPTSALIASPGRTSMAPANVSGTKNQPAAVYLSREMLSKSGDTALPVQPVGLPPARPNNNNLPG
ncbi:uncharacterized protein LOC143444226 isoform X3 [Clavelina lepadiformis]|uniref:uncharacterized protein LOC143444226 isoform X3 n=1 Tax=Clavelina lepadiformis TaxID=159417 RepID=UPI004042C19B